jgi:pterin-4a-carbinolamine dehydratase
MMYMLEEDWQLDPAAAATDADDNDGGSPQALVREYHHRDYMGASTFISKIAAVGDLNNHFPTISLERKLISREKRWEVTTTVRCHTVVLGGLSRNDFHVAMLIDVETARPEVNQYLI